MKYSYFVLYFNPSTMLFNSSSFNTYISRKEKNYQNCCINTKSCNAALVFLMDFSRLKGWLTTPFSCMLLLQKLKVNFSRYELDLI